MASVIRQHPGANRKRRPQTGKCQQQAGKSETSIKKAAPHRRIHMRAQLNADPAKDEQPQNDHQRQIKSTEGGSVEKRECEIECAANGQKPDFVAVPHGTDGSQQKLAFPVCAGNKQIERTHAAVEAIQNHISGDHSSDQQKPCGEHWHSLRLPLPSALPLSPALDRARSPDASGTETESPAWCTGP